MGGTSDYMVHAIRWKQEERGYGEICRENEKDEVQGEWRKKRGFLWIHTLCCKEWSSRLCTLRKRSKPQEATNGREVWHCNPRTAPARPLRHPRTSPAGRERRKQGQTKQHSQEFNNIAVHIWRTAGQIHPLYLEHTQIQDKKPWAMELQFKTTAFVQIQTCLREKINGASTYCLPFRRSRMASSPWVLPTTTVPWLAGRESAVSGYSPNRASNTGLLWGVEGSYTRTWRRRSRTERTRYFESCLITDVYLKTQRKTWINTIAKG